MKRLLLPENTALAVSRTSLIVNACPFGVSGFFAISCSLSALWSSEWNPNRKMVLHLPVVIHVIRLASKRGLLSRLKLL